jgi:TetR/AcrR family transcriptional regulator
VKSPMRRFGAENSATRAALVQAGIAVLQEEGATGLTAKRVAEQAGLKPQLVHYYFRTIEDLVIAIVREVGDESLKRTVRAAASDRPLLELWRACKHEDRAALAAEIKALAQHSDAIRVESVRLIEQHRNVMAEAIGRHLERLGVDPKRPPIATAIIMDALARLLVDEKALGITFGHDIIEMQIEGWLEDFYATGALDMTADRDAA